MPLNRLVLPGFVGLCALVVLQNAWLHEDAFITFRSVDNFINGHGPTWNIGERVQTFTHPLWFFALSTAYALTGEIFYTGIFLAWAVSLSAVLVMALRLAPSPGHAGLGIALLCSSKAFVDYSTSGLENPLSHLLLALFTALYFHWQPTLRALTLLALVAGLATFNRMDTLLLYLPALGVGVWRLQAPRALGAVAIGFAPFIIWEFFSLCYYGFLFPNTAYGKLSTGIPATDLAQQGIYYLYNSLQVDPLTLVVIAAGAAGICYASKRPQLPLVAGLLLYLVYIVKVGGDYMSGRLLSTPFFGAVLLIVYNLRIPTRKRLYFTLVAILAVGLAMPYTPLKSGLDYGQRGAPGSHDIVDERANYYAHTGLLPALMADIAYPRHEWVDLGRTMAEKSRASEGVVTTFINLGILGYYAGPLAHHLDVLGIADPLLARLPAFADPDWAPGHFTRIVPEGYIATQLYGYNLIADQNLAAYYDKLRIVIGGPLFSGDRWAKIWQLNTGHYDQLIDYDAYRHPTAEQRARSQAQLSPPIRPRPDALTRAIEAGNIFFARRQFARAATAYQQAIDLRPNQPSSHHNLAAVFLATGDTRQARATFQKAAELGSQIAETYRALIWLAQKVGDGEGAQRAYRLAAQHLPTSAMTALSEYLKASP